MKLLRITTAFILTVVLLAAAFHTASVAVENRVYGASVSFNSNNGKNLILIPVNIEYNAGFMGFAITITYDEDLFRPVAVQRGTLLSGLFENNIGYNTPGTLRVVYSGSEDCEGDGELFTLTFEDLSAFTDECTVTIGLAYSQQDTFNEQWRDVMLNCEDIQVTLKGTVSEPTSEPETEPESEPEESTTKSVVEPQPEKKLSERLAEWYSRRPVIVRVLLWIFIKPLIRIIAATE